MENIAVGTDHIRNSLRCTILLRSAAAVSDADLTFGVAKQRIRKRLIISELLVRRDVVGAAAQNLNIFCFKVLDSITESLALSRSATGARAWVEPQHDRLPFIVAQPDRVALVIENFKVRRLVTCIQHKCLL